MYYFSLFFFVAVISLILPDTYLAPNTEPVNIWYQFVFFFVSLLIFYTRGAYSFKNEDGPQRFIKCRNEMTVAYFYGILYAVVSISCSVFMESHTETRFIITTTSRCLLALIVGYFSGNTVLTCFIDYNWVTFPTIIIFWFVRYGVRSILHENYYNMGNMWTSLIVTGLLELYHVWTGRLTSNFAYISYQETEVQQRVTA